LCTFFFFDLTKATLNGWSFTAISDQLNSSDIIVSFKDEKYIINSIILSKPKIVNDFLDALNEFFLCISYFICYKNKNFKLLHCSAFSENGKNIIVTGAKKSGKSRLVYSKAKSGNLIYADDLLLWSHRDSVFTSIGLPLRLRRARELIENQPVKGKFLFGKNILYSHNSHFNIAPLGMSFELDKVLFMEDNFQAKDIPIFKFFNFLKDYIIDEDLYKLEKETIL
jgi:hypothetical protein